MDNKKLFVLFLLRFRHEIDWVCYKSLSKFRWLCASDFCSLCDNIIYLFIKYFSSEYGMMSAIEKSIFICIYILKSFFFFLLLISSFFLSAVDY